MVVLHTCKNEEDPIKTEDTRVLTRLYVIFFFFYVAMFWYFSPVRYLVQPF